ncbi:MAG: hypothetical protein U0929_11595 [Planctomycetaceae bacterium]
MDFALRPASVNWESLVLVPGTAVGMWIWCKPPHAPLDLIVRVPIETVQAYGGRLTLRQLALAAGAEMVQVHGMLLAGVFLDAMGGANSQLDQPVPPQAPWCEIVIRMLGTGAFPVLAPVMVAPQPALANSPSGAATAVAIEADWSSVMTMGSQLLSLRKQLVTLQGRLQNLNRDLSFDEYQSTDSQMKREWQETRRWLSDASLSLARYIKEADAGVTTMAGSKRRMEQLVMDARSGRMTPQQMAAAQNEIESHRKTVINIQNQMQSALLSASRDGEQRAQQVLSRIAAKVRASRTKR